jgi:glycyl-tRNA synthetase beta chain
LIARGLPLQTDPVSEERKGPRADAPAQALEGFLRSTGLTREQLVERADAKGNAILFAVIEKPGRATSDVLAEAIPAIVRAFPWPKSMRWGKASQTTESLRWVRPLQGIVAILGEDLVDIEIDGVRSGFTTVGHRFHHSGDITIGGANDYAEKLRACHVIVSHAERQAIIAEKAAEAAASKGYVLVEDKGLVAENAGLTEWPVPLIGDFDPAFLEVPPEVIQLTLRVNQKYFVVQGADGKLAPAFICTANIEAKDGGAAIVAGNRKVLAARLSDARFFWEQDRKTSLEDHAKKLGRITFHEKLGTVADKVERVAKLARWLVEEGIVGGRAPAQAGAQGAQAQSDPGLLPSQEHGKEDLATLAEQAARLAKADLVTEMVGEFPELQGVMGGYYARAEGLPDAVADAIRDHYKPVGQGDDVPTAPVTVAVSLADKLDTLIGFFAVDERPSGSRDPFALRRAALGDLALRITHSLHLETSKAIHLLQELVSKKSWEMQWNLISDLLGRSVLDLVAEFGSLGQSPDGKITVHHVVDGQRGEKVLEVDETPDIRMWRLLEQAYLGLHYSPKPLLDFFADRLKVQQREAGVRHDLIDAVFALGGEDDLVRLLARVKALQAFVATEDGANLLAGYKRAANILKKEAPGASPVMPAQAGISGGGAPTPETPASAGVTNLGMEPLSYTPEKEEAALIAALDVAEPRAADAVAREDFAGAMSALATLRAPIDAFFETVMVNDPDEAKKAARLALLARMRDAVHQVADFSQIAG